jgi:hypothetical protein
MLRPGHPDPAGLPTGWPFEYTIGGIALTPDDAEHNGTATTDEPVVWIGEGRQAGYLPGTASNALGWSR